VTAERPRRQPLLSDEPTVELITKARGGDREALEALLQRCVPSLTRWAHGRLPASARGSMDTGDLVQEAVMRAIGRLDTFEPRHVGAMQAYLRQSVINRIIDEVRRVTRHPSSPFEPELEIPSAEDSPLDAAIAGETYDRYRAALATLKPRERKIVVARVELRWGTDGVAAHFGFATPDAARMAATRALERLAKAMQAANPKTS